MYIHQGAYDAECAALARALETAARRQTAPEKATIATNAQAAVGRTASEGGTWPHCNVNAVDGRSRVLTRDSQAQNTNVRSGSVSADGTAALAFEMDGARTLRSRQQQPMQGRTHIAHALPES